MNDAFKQKINDLEQGFRRSILGKDTEASVAMLTERSTAVGSQGVGVITRGDYACWLQGLFDLCKNQELLARRMLRLRLH